MEKKHKIKCIIWDLDNTLWNGVLLEDDRVTLRPGVLEIIQTLDERGILQSISSKNEHGLTMAKLKEFGIAEYFLYPQINWNPKSESVKTIVASINIGMDTIAFIDDQPFEREEVKFVLPEVLCIDAADLDRLIDMPEMQPEFITEDSKLRRFMYLSDIQRKEEEETFSGPQEEFLASLQMIFTIAPVGEGDLQRAEELTVRTHQLNTTGYTYSYEELDQFRKSDRHKLLIAALEDKFGTYGKIGLVLLECGQDVWTIKLLLMSCRVMSRGVGSVLINYLMSLAKSNKVRLRAEFVSTDRNRMMYVTYKFAGFKEIEEKGDFVVFENNLEQVQPFPGYMKVNVEEAC
jgi:FkbH-like protein